MNTTKIHPHPKGCGILSKTSDNTEWNSQVNWMLDAFYLIHNKGAMGYWNSMVVDRGLALFKKHFLNLWMTNPKNDS